MRRNSIGKLLPKYSFALNPYADSRFSRCPRCQKLMYLRKFALLIHVERSGLKILGKTCRYCANCQLIIAHQNDLEAELAHIFSKRASEAIGNPYLVFGTVELKAWRQGLHRSVSLDDLLERAADFKQYIKLSVDPGGWRPNGRKRSEDQSDWGGHGA